jgi:hypothetical protein
MTIYYQLLIYNRTSVVMVGVLVSSVVNLSSSPDRVKPDYKIGLCCLLKVIKFPYHLIDFRMQMGHVRS